MVVEPDEVLLPSDGFVVLLSEGTEEVLPRNGSVLSVLLDFCLEPEFFSLPIAGDLSGSPFFSHPIVMNKMPKGRVLFGTHAPLLIPEAALIRTHESSRLNEKSLRALLAGNAQAVLKA